MDVEEAREFIRSHNQAVLATWRRDGGIQMSPVLIGIDAEGRGIVSTWA